MNDKLDKDHYNSSFRESMKKSMAFPARRKGEWKPLNRRNYDLFDRLAVMGILGLVVIAAMWGVWGLLARIGR